MKICACCLLFFTLILSAKNPLESYQWKNRLLVIALSAKQDEESKNALRKSLEEAQADLADRDILIVDLSEPSANLTLSVQLSTEERGELRKRFKIKTDASSQFLLVGKDGGVKAQQTNTLKLSPLLILIDGMPMRRQEMEKPTS